MTDASQRQLRSTALLSLSWSQAISPSGSHIALTLHPEVQDSSERLERRTGGHASTDVTGASSNSGSSSSSRPRSSSDQIPSSPHNSGASTFSWPHILPATQGARPHDLNDDAQSRLIAPADNGKRPMLHDNGAAHGKRIQMSYYNPGRTESASASSAGRERTGRRPSTVFEGTGAGTPVTAAAQAPVGPPEKKRRGEVQPGHSAWIKDLNLKGQIGPDGQLTLDRNSDGSERQRSGRKLGSTPWNKGLTLKDRVGPDGKPIPYNQNKDGSERKRPGPKPRSAGVSRQAGRSAPS